MRYAAEMSSQEGTAARKEQGAVLWLSRLALLGLVYFLGTVIAFHFLRPDYDPTWRFVSEYAVGTYGSLMTAAFYALGIASTALLMGLVLGVSREGTSIAGLILLGIWCVGVFVAAAFPIDAQGSIRTIFGSIHGFAALVAFGSLLPGAIAITRCLARDERWKSSRRSLWTLALICPCAFVLYYLASSRGFGGLAQRLFFVSILAWLFLVSWKLNRNARGRS